MRPNKLRAALDGRLDATLGTRIYTAVPGIVELIGHAGTFDYVEFLAEPAPFDLFALENLCRAAELYDLSSIIKIEQTAMPFVAQRAVGAGFQGVLFADVRMRKTSRERSRRLARTRRTHAEATAQRDAGWPIPAVSEPRNTSRR